MDRIGNILLDSLVVLYLEVANRGSKPTMVRANARLVLDVTFTLAEILRSMTE